MTAVTTINRTPFRPVGEIPARLLASDKLKWHMPDSDRVVHFTTDGKHFGYEHDVGASSGLWRPVSPGHVFRPVGMTWEAAKEAVCAATAATPPPPQQPKAEEPFRPGLPPAELRAVCKEWEWRCYDGVRATDFVGDCHRFLDICRNGRRRSPQEMSESAIPLVVCNLDHFRPLGRTWADVETAVKAAKTTTAQLPKDGDIITVASAVAIVKEGCRQALDEAATRRQPGKSGNFSHITYINPWPPRTFIIASPPGRRKYVKLLLKRLGYRNVDKIPTTDKQTPFDLGRSLPDHERENLLAIAPGIVLRDVL